MTGMVNRSPEAPPPKSGPDWGRTAGRFYLGFCAVFLAAPVIVVSAAALNGGRSMAFPPEDPTLSRFVEFFVGDPVWTDALRTSILLAFASAAIGTAIAWPVAYAVWRRGGWAATLLASLVGLPFVLPPIVFGVGLGFFWAFTAGLGDLWAGILSHAILHAAIPLATVSIGLAAIDRAHLDAAATMGATEAVTLRTIVIPQTFPYTVSGFLFALILSFNEFIVVYFVAASSYATVTLQIFNSLRNGFTPTMAVAAITFIGASLLIFAAIGRWGDLPGLMGADTSRSD